MNENNPKEGASKAEALGKAILQMIPQIAEDNTLLKEGLTPTSPMVEKEILVVLPESIWQVLSAFTEIIKLKDSLLDKDNNEPEVEALFNQVNNVTLPYKDYSLPVAVVSNILSKSLTDFAVMLSQQELMIELQEALASGDNDKFKEVTEKIKHYAKYFKV